MKIQEGMLEGESFDFYTLVGGKVKVSDYKWSKVDFN